MSADLVIRNGVVVRRYRVAPRADATSQSKGIVIVAVGGETSVGST
jgi:hypothetical protein